MAASERLLREALSVAPDYTLNKLFLAETLTARVRDGDLRGGEAARALDEAQTLLQVRLPAGHLSIVQFSVIAVRHALSFLSLCLSLCLCAGGCHNTS